VLDESDAPAMLALATLTRPGPFRSQTRKLGPFIGVKREGQLVAMAGRRLRVDGFTELSGVCTHPDHRGQGYAAALSRAVVAETLASGEAAFLHAFAEHEATIAFYRGLGFQARARMTYTLLGDAQEERPGAYIGRRSNGAEASSRSATTNTVAAMTGASTAGPWCAVRPRRRPCCRRPCRTRRRSIQRKPWSPPCPVATCCSSWPTPARTASSSTAIATTPRGRWARTSAAGCRSPR